jgi:hypothetical protein
MSLKERKNQYPLVFRPYYFLRQEVLVCMMPPLQTELLASLDLSGKDAERFEVPLKYILSLLELAGKQQSS